MSIRKRIVCTDQLPIGNPPTCAKIISVGASTDGSEIADEKLSLDEVISQIERGIIFYTYGKQSNKYALVEKYWCIRCVGYHIRSKADAVYDNNLDSLRYCSWRKAV